MTVKELKEQLKGVQDDLDVYISAPDEYSLMADEAGISPYFSNTVFMIMAVDE